MGTPSPKVFERWHTLSHQDEFKTSIPKEAFQIENLNIIHECKK